MKSVDVASENISAEKWASPFITGGAVVGVAGLAIAGGMASMQEHGAKTFFGAYLVNFCFFMAISLGALFFVVLQHLVRAGWSVVVRRIAEALSLNLILMAVLLIGIFAGFNSLYPWTDHEYMAHSELMQHKQVYLNKPFFMIRTAVYFLFWIGLALFFYRNSVKQDKTGDVELTHKMHNVSAPSMLGFALTVTFFAFDYLMSLDPVWFSTIFGVYFFAGCFLSISSSLVVIVIVLQRSGKMGMVNAEHFQDLGKLIFAFIVFWSYIAYSQYMLIWYADLPEETHWYLVRQTGSWTNLSIFLIFGHFIIPFFALISRIPKRRKHMLLIGALWVLMMEWIDLYWLIAPQLSEPGVIPFNVVDVLCFIGIGGLFVACTARNLRGTLIPVRDPRLHESLGFENI